MSNEKSVTNPSPITCYECGFVAKSKDLVKKAISKGKHTVASITIKAGGHLVLNPDEQTNAESIRASVNNLHRGIRKLKTFGKVGFGVVIGMSVVNAKDTLFLMPETIKKVMDSDIPPVLKPLKASVMAVKTLTTDAFKTPLLSEGFTPLDNAKRLAIFALAAKNAPRSLNSMKKALSKFKILFDSEDLKDTVLDAVNKASDYMRENNPENYDRLVKSSQTKALAVIAKNARAENKEKIKADRKEKLNNSSFAKILENIKEKNPIAIVSKKKQKVVKDVTEKATEIQQKAKQALDKKINNGFDRIYDRFSKNNKGR